MGVGLSLLYQTRSLGTKYMYWVCNNDIFLTYSNYSLGCVYSLIVNRVNFTITEQLHEDAKTYCKQFSLELSELIRHLLRIELYYERTFDKKAHLPPDNRFPRCPLCHKTPFNCLHGGYNPKTNKFRKEDHGSEENV